MSAPFDFEAFISGLTVDLPREQVPLYTVIHQSRIDDLNAQMTKIEAQIAELTTYERDYRRQLKDFISGQLKVLETSASVAPEQTVKH